MSAAGGDEGAGLPPPPPVPEGAVPARAPGYGGDSGNAAAAAAGGAVGTGAPAVRERDMIPVPNKATRPSFGRDGREVALCANHFKANVVKWDDVYHYNVSIEPPVENKKICRDIMAKLRETFGVSECGGKHGAYDGEKSLFTSGSLSFNSKEFPVFLDDRKGPAFRHGGSPSASSPPQGSPAAEGVPKRRRTAARGRDYVVRIEFAARVRTKAIDEMLRGALTGRGDPEQEKRALDALRVLDIVLRESASSRNYLLVRDNFFHPSLGQVGDLGEGVEAWRGYHSSVRPTGLGLTLNLDITMTTVLKPILVEVFLLERFNVSDLSRMQGRDWAKAKSILKGIRVETVHMEVARTHKIAGFSDRPIRELKFPKRVKDGQGGVREEEMSVEKYYFDVYSYTLKYPNLPALDVGNKKKPTFFPIELCKIVAGQRYIKSLSSKQRMKQIAACKQSPLERQRICEDAIRVSRYSDDRIIQEFGLHFENKLAGVKGRMLPPPQLEFGDGRTEQPREGRWNFTDKKLRGAVKIDPWAVVVFDPRCNDGKFIGEKLRDSCCRRGMKMEKPMRVVEEPHNAQNYPPEQRVERMFGALKDCHPRPIFILAILPDKDSPIYVPLKRICETKIGIISQCMVKPRQVNDQYLGNLALKINLKFGGFNSPLSPRMMNCLLPSSIIFGMDVSHGSPGDVNVPSIAAVVATKNWPEVFHYSIQTRTQPAKTEMIEDLRNMVKDCLVTYYKTCKVQALAKPTQIIVYRDGVSESQFQECLEVEFTAIKLACRDMPGDYNPGVTFIVAQKRHNTRFFPQGSDKLRNGNVLPGTVVDKDVCHPHSYDFFLVSQAGLIGTSRPTHYHVLVNENRLTPDDIQSLTNNLCYTFGRCTTSISMDGNHVVVVTGNQINPGITGLRIVLRMYFPTAPAAYAHVVAARYRKLVDTWGGSDTSSLRSSREGGAGGSVARPVPKLPALVIPQEYSMFFC